MKEKNEGLKLFQIGFDVISIPSSFPVSRPRPVLKRGIVEFCGYNPSVFSIWCRNSQFLDAGQKSFDQGNW